MVRVHAGRLESQGEAHLAAMHLLSAGDVRPALGVYRRAGLLQEALAAASARLLPSDPVLQASERPRERSQGLSK